MKENMINIAKDFAKEIEKEETTFEAARKLAWSFNLPMAFIDGEVFWFHGNNIKQVAVPAEIIIKLSNIEKTARSLVNAAYINAARQAGCLDEYNRLKDGYESSKEELFEKRQFAVKMESIPFGKELIDMRNVLMENSAECADSVRKYYAVTQASEAQFYGEKGMSGLPDYFPTPIGVEKDSYWETMRLLLPRWVVRCLKSEGNKFVALDNINRSNGTYDYRCYSNRTKDNEEKSESDKIYDVLRVFFKNFVDASDIREIDGDPSNLIDTVEGNVKSGLYSKWAVAYAAKPLFEAGFIDKDIFCKVTTLSVDEATNWLKNQKEADQKWVVWKKNEVIDEYVGKCHRLAWINNLSDETKFNLMREGMVNNVKSPDFKRLLRKCDTIDLLYKYYRRITSGNKVRPELKFAETMLLVSPEKLMAARAEAALNFQNDQDSIRDLLRTEEWKFQTPDKAWDKFLTDVRTKTRLELADTVKILVDSPFKTVRGAGNGSEVNVNLSEQIAAHKVFSHMSEMIISGFADISKF